MSLCDTCKDPGACCRRLSLFKMDGEAVTYWADQGVDGIREQVRELGLPFEPLEKFEGPWIDQESGRPYETWALTCPKLGPDGRCTIYEDRPDLCRRYEAASDGLCVHYTPAIERGAA